MMKKRIFGIFFTMLFLAGSLGSSAYAMMEQDKYEISLGQGMTLKKISEVYDSGVQNINIVTADLNNPNIKLDLLFNQNGISKKGKVSDMVKQESNVVAAMNADFFSMASPSFSIGAMVKDGKQISTPHYAPNVFGTLLVDENQQAAVKYIKSGVYLENMTKGMTTVANSINKPNAASKGIVVYTSEYRGTTLGVNGSRPNLVEIIVKAGVVTDVRVAQPATYIPSDGYAIVSDTASGRDLAKRFSVGDSVRLKTEITMNYPSTKMAVGGGSILVKDGVPTKITKTVGGKSQRSAFAVTSDNKILFVTVDGRGMGGAIGMSEKDMQSFLLTQNVKDAIIFDGGGSTELVVDSKIENKLNDERAVINAVALKNTAPKGSASTIEIKPLRSVFVQGEKIPLSVKIFDAQGNLLPSAGANISAQGVSGSYDGKHFVFNSGGNGQIIASLGGASGSVDVEVIGKNMSDPHYASVLEGVSFAVATNTQSSSEDIMMQAITTKLQQELKKAPSVVLMGNKDSNFISALNNTTAINKGGLQTLGNTGYLLLNTSGSNLSGQWDTLNNALNSSVSNLVIFTNSKVNLSGKPLEIFQKLVHNASKTKNIYIVEKNGSYGSYQEGLVSRISVKDINMTSMDNLSNFKYLVFYEKQGVLYYTFRTLF